MTIFYDYSISPVVNLIQNGQKVEIYNSADWFDPIIIRIEA
jgi:hypothetical protein